MSSDPAGAGERSEVGGRAGAGDGAGASGRVGARDGTGADRRAGASDRTGASNQARANGRTGAGNRTGSDGSAMAGGRSRAGNRRIATGRSGTHSDPAADFPDLRRWSERHPAAATVLRLIGLLVMVVALAKSGEPAGWPVGAVAVVAALVAMVALARRHPAVVPAAVVFGLCGAVLVGTGWGQATGLTLMFISVLYLQAAGGSRVVAMCTAGALMVAGGISALLTGHPGNLGWIIGIPLGGYVFGDARRSRLLALQRAQELLAMTRRANAEQAHAAALAERGRIARDVHDVLAHSLSGLAIQLEAADALLTEGSDIDAAHTMVVRARRLARDGLSEVRRAVAALREDVKPLEETLERLVADYGADTGWSASFEVIDGPVPALAVETAQGLQRVAQEALANARKHAPGAAVEVRLAVGAREITLTVTNGAPTRGGTALAESGGGWGIVGLRERVELLGGTVMAGVVGPAEAAKSGGPAEAAESVEVAAAGPVETAEPVGPAEAAEPVEVTQAGGPVEAVKPGGPAEPGRPVAVAELVEAAELAGPAEAAEPVEVAETAGKPVEAAGPAVPVEAAESGGPSEAAEPAGSGGWRVIATVPIVTSDIFQN